MVRFFITNNLLRISPSLKTMNNLLDGDHNDDDTDDDCLEVMKTEIKNSNSIKNVLMINGRYKFTVHFQTVVSSSCKCIMFILSQTS